MKRIRTWLNIALGSLVSLLGLSGCDRALVKYGPPEDFEVLYGPAPIEEDSTVNCKYGVNPNFVNEINETND